MFVSIDKFPKKYNRDLFERALDFAIEKLRLPLDYDLQIDFLRNLGRSTTFGGTIGDHEEAVIEIKNTLCEKTAIAVLFHELVHVKQMSELRLKSAIGFLPNIWEGKEYPDEMPWEERPWEIEALLMEKKLLKDFYHPES